MQSAWEQSGKFEGDIVLTDEQRKEWFNVASPSPNGVVPFVTEVVFSEYCSTKLQSWNEEWGGEYRFIAFRFVSSAHWRLGGRSNGDNYHCLTLKIITHSQTHINTNTCQASHFNIHTVLRSI